MSYYTKDYFLTKPLKAYCIFNAFNIFIHILNYHLGFLGFIADGLLYLSKIIICYFLYKKIKERNNDRYAVMGWIVKTIMAADVIELFVSVTSVKTCGLVFVLLMLLFGIKEYLDFYLFYLILNPQDEFFDIQEKRRTWTVFNISVLIVALLSAFISFFPYILYFLLFVRYICERKIIKNSKENEVASVEGTVIGRLSKIELSKTARYSLLGVAGVFLILFFWMRYSKPEGQYELEAYDGKYTVRSSEDFFHEADNGILGFCISNRMPEWTGFSEQWWGVIDDESGTVTEAEYDQYIYFDESGIAWDGNGHFIDTKGDVVISVSSLVMNKRSPRATIINDYLDISFEQKDPSDEFDIFEWISDRITCERRNPYYGPHDFYMHWEDHSGHIVGLDDFMGIDMDGKDLYFINHVAVFYSEKDGAYGLINDKGEVIVSPSLYNVRMTSRSNLIYVHQKRSGYFNVLNYDGEYLLDKNRDWRLGSHDDDSRTIRVSDHSTYIKISYDGEIVEVRE